MIGSIAITNNPVAGTEKFLLNVSENGDARYEDYSVTDRADGGFWNCQFRLFSRENVLKDLFENGLGRHVEVWGEGLQQDFEGYIHEMTYNLPPDRYTVSLENTVNKIHMRTDYDADGDVERTTTLENSDSQDRFGIKEQVLSGGEIEGLSVADQATQTHINLKGFPRPEPSLGSGRGQEYVEVFCRGYIYTLGWRIYNQTASTGNQGMSTQIKDILDSVGQFVASHEREINNTLVTKEYDADRTALDIITNMVSLGDTNNHRWIAYMVGRTVTDGVGRKFILKQAAPSTPPSD